MPRNVLDSDSIIDFLAGIRESVQLVQALDLQGDLLCTTDAVIGEVYSGLDPADRAEAEDFLSSVIFLATSPAMARQAGAWRYAYARRGVALSMTDCLIAATAYAHGAQIVTGNVRHFPMPEVNVVPLPRPRRP